MLCNLFLCWLFLSQKPNFKCQVCVSCRASQISGENMPLLYEQRSSCRITPHMMYHILHSSVHATVSSHKLWALAASFKASIYLHPKQTSTRVKRAISSHTSGHYFASTYFLDSHRCLTTSVPLGPTLMLDYNMVLSPSYGQAFGLPHTLTPSYEQAFGLPNTLIRALASLTLSTPHTKGPLASLTPSPPHTDGP